MGDYETRCTLLVPHDTPLAEMESERRHLIDIFYKKHNICVYPFYPLAAFLGDKTVLFWKSLIQHCVLGCVTVYNKFLLRPLQLSGPEGTVFVPNISFPNGLVLPAGIIYGISATEENLPPLDVSEFPGTVPLVLRVMRLCETDIFSDRSCGFSLYWKINKTIWIKLAK